MRILGLNVGSSDSCYVAGHNSLETQNELWVPDDAAWNNLPNAFYSIRLSLSLPIFSLKLDFMFGFHK